MATGVQDGPIANEHGATIGREHRTSVLAWLHLRRVHTRIAQAEAGLLADFGLTLAQFDVLSRLASEDGLSQQAVADRLLVTKGNICGIVDRLEAAGLVARERDPNDRRSNQLRLTASGSRCFEAAAPALEAMLAEQMGELASDEQATLLSLVARLDRALRSES